MDGLSRTSAGTVTRLPARCVRVQTPRFGRDGRHGSGGESFRAGATRLRQRRPQETPAGLVGRAGGSAGEGSVFLPGEADTAHQAPVRGGVARSPGAAGSRRRGGPERSARARVSERVQSHARIRARSSLLLRTPVRPVRRAAGRRGRLLPRGGEGATGPRPGTAAGEPERPLGDPGERSRADSVLQVPGADFNSC